MSLTKSSIALTTLSNVPSLIAYANDNISRLSKFLFLLILPKTDSVEDFN